MNDRRRYRFTPAGLAARLASIRQHRPWERSTGPRTREGKRRAAMNGWVNRLRWRVVSVHAEEIRPGVMQTTTYYAGGFTITRVVAIP